MGQALGAAALAWVCGGSPAQAASTFAPPPVASWQTGVTVVSDYVFRGLRLGGASVQPYAELEYGAWRAGLWSSVPLDDAVPGRSDPEIDAYVTHAWRLSDRLELQGGATVYHFPRDNGAPGWARSRLEPQLGLAFTGSGYRVSGKLAQDLQWDGTTAELAGIYAYPLTRLGTELNVTAAVGTTGWRDAGARGQPRTRRWGEYWSLGVSVPFQVTAAGRVALGVSYAEGTNQYVKVGTLPRMPAPKAAGRAVVSLSYTHAY